MREPFREHSFHDFSASGYSSQQPEPVQATTIDPNVVTIAVVLGALGLAILGAYVLTK